MPDRYLVTHSLLSSWMAAIQGSIYGDEPEDPWAEFMSALRREKTTPTEAMLRGIQFEDDVTAILEGDDAETEFPIGAHIVADIVRGGSLQVVAKKEMEIDGLPVLLYGRLDVLRCGVIYDIKCSRTYTRGKFFASTQHPVYMEIVPDASRFVYVVSDGKNVWTETYRRDECRPIRPIISEFFCWLHQLGLWEEYSAHWRSN